MRGQLEKIEGQYDYLEKQQATYSQILSGLAAVHSKKFVILSSIYAR